ncbi:MAG: quinone oxidoreductase, partial [Mesorhizobium sp.]
MTYEDADPGQPGSGQILVRHTAIGLNFIDVYHRSGLYPPPGGFPLIPGSEAAGVVVEVGADIDWLKPGDRIAYAVPDGISDEQAAAMMLKGMTAEYLLRRTFKVKAGDTILFHAAAGGVGLILGQWAKHLGATVIGTASSADKIELAKAHGFDHVINYREQD